MHLLFICGRNRRRSPTAERLFDGVAGVRASSAGVSPDADEPLTAEAVETADVVFVMEESHRAKANRHFAKALRGKRVVCLGILDEYEFMDRELVRLLWDRVPRSIPALTAARP